VGTVLCVRAMRPTREGDLCDEGFSCLLLASASYPIHNCQELSLAEQFNAFVAVLSRLSLDLTIYLLAFFVGRIDPQPSQPLSDLDAHFRVTLPSRG
jgi:hypothetical protein